MEIKYNQDTKFSEEEYWIEDIPETDPDRDQKVKILRAYEYMVTHKK